VFHVTGVQTCALPISTALCTARQLLVVLDCDGTLTPIAEHPSLARPNRATLAVLERLAAAPGTEVAVVSGRRRAELEDLFPIEEIGRASCRERRKGGV